MKHSIFSVYNTKTMFFYLFFQSERKSLQHYPWYHLVDAKEASKRLVRMGRNGAFLIRPASNPTNDVLNTLCVMCFGRVYNFHIRNLKDGRITLGRKCKGEQIEVIFTDFLFSRKFMMRVEKGVM